MGGFEVSRSLLRYVPYTTRQDPTVEPEYSAYCVAGDEEACGAQSEKRDNPTDVDDWMRGHMKVTGHMHFRRRFEDFAELTVSGMPTDLQPAHVKRVTT
ncbi:DUF7848 domain-containing protein [Streptomyces sp. NBC_00252]|uniref:DUF7848 domain-containing protein n=1 Tax=Streptomyces sp. NBC_00252 TaxID=2975691 RepID=UPI003FA6A238